MCYGHFEGRVHSLWLKKEVAYVGAAAKTFGLPTAVTTFLSAQCCSLPTQKPYCKFDKLVSGCFGNKMQVSAGQIPLLGSK